MPTLTNWKSCCGCAACANKCSNNAINMRPNFEGFLHPVIDSAKCIECRACEKVCPGLEVANNISTELKIFVVQHKDSKIRYQSTSGGGFTAIAEEIIRRDGVVFGATMTKDFSIKHDYVSDIEGLAKFRNSKYVQSEIDKQLYATIKDFLRTKKYVCFSGTPCQVNGLYKYLGKDYENLITVDVVCKSVPSPLIFEKYIEYKKGKEGNFSDVVFRDKKRGFLYCTMAHYLSHEDRLLAKSIYRKGSESDEWLRLFLSGKISRHSCMTCPYQTIHRVSDFTLGDIWETGNPKLDDNKGTTLLHVWTSKGKRFLKNIRSNVRIESFPIEMSRSVERNNTLKIFSDRDKLFEDAHNMPADAFFSKYTPYTIKIGTKQICRYIIWKLHLHNFVRNIKHKNIHR